MNVVQSISQPITTFNGLSATSDKPTLDLTSADSDNLVTPFPPPPNCSTLLPTTMQTLPTAVTSCQFGIEQFGVPVQVALDHPLCGGCGFDIRDKYLLKVANDYWHENCLICFCCGMPLRDAASCFIRENRVYCQEDYKTLYSIKCGKCALGLLPTDLVYRGGMSAVYHARCFSCVYCGQTLRRGDHYLMLEGQVICKQDYELLLCNPAMNPVLTGFYDPEGESSRKQPKRPRTILTSQQRRAFKASFEQSAKPCRKVRETLAKDTGLSVRVVQVWFQNQRAKMKKIQRKQELQRLQQARKNGNSTAPATTAPEGGQSSSNKSDSESFMRSASGSKSPESLLNIDSDAENDDGRGDSSDADSPPPKDANENNSLLISAAGKTAAQHLSMLDAAQGSQPSELPRGPMINSVEGQHPIDRLYSMQHTYLY